MKYLIPLAALLFFVCVVAAERWLDSTTSTSRKDPEA